MTIPKPAYITSMPSKVYAQKVADLVLAGIAIGIPIGATVATTIFLAVR